MHYWFRQFKEEPLRVMIFMALAALCWLYQDNKASQDAYRADMKEQNAALIEQIRVSTETLQQAVVQLKSMDNRLQHLEREHEQARTGK